MKKIYLAGGMRGNWQDKIINAITGHIYYDPRHHGLSHPKDYTKWDLDHVRDADVVFACFTSENPTGLGMCIEIGYAAALGIPIILVDEKKLRSWDMVRQVSGVCFDNLEDGINMFKKILGEV